MFRNCTYNCYCYDPYCCCYRQCNYCCCNYRINAYDYRYCTRQIYASNIKSSSFRRVSDMPSKKKSSFDNLEIKKPKRRSAKAKDMDCPCTDTYTEMNKRIQEIDKKLCRCKCIASDESRPTTTAPPVVNDDDRNEEKREVYLLPYYGVPIKKNKKYILECTSFESTDASCSEMPDCNNNNNNNQNYPCPRMECNIEPMPMNCKTVPNERGNFVGRCTSYESLNSLQPTKRNSCHCCCSKKPNSICNKSNNNNNNNNRSRRCNSSPVSKCWSELDVIDEEDVELMEELPPTSKRKFKDCSNKPQGNIPKCQPTRKCDLSAIASCFNNARGKAKTNGNVNGNGNTCCWAPNNANANGNGHGNGNARGNYRGNGNGNGNGYAYSCAPAYASGNGNCKVRNIAKSNGNGYAYGNANYCVPDSCNDTVPGKTPESQMQKSLEDSCADFLNIVTDNILETVQTSVSMTLKDYCTKTTEKIDQAFVRLEQNDETMRCLCGRLMEKLTQQNERDFEKICSLLHQLKQCQQSKAAPVAKVCLQSRASQYEVSDSVGNAPCAVEQSEMPYFVAQERISNARVCTTAQKTDEAPPSRGSSQQQSTPQSTRTSVNAYGQNENLENANGKNVKNGNVQDEIVVNEIQQDENENTETLNKVVMPPCRCCDKCSCTPKRASFTAPPRPNIVLETDEKKRTSGRECGGSSDPCSEVGEETLSPSGYHFVSDKGKPNGNAPENRTSSNDSTNTANRRSNTAPITATTSGMFTTFSMKSNQKTFFQSTTNNNGPDIPATRVKEKNIPELDLYGMYDTSGYATEPEDNNDITDGTSVRRRSSNEPQFLPVTLQYVRHNPSIETKLGTFERSSTTKKHSKKRTKSSSRSASSHLSRL